MSAGAHVVIVGGGITGLAAVEHITRVAPDMCVTLLESRPRLGGHIRSVAHDGFLMEAGPDVILTSKPAAVELAKRVGLGGRLQGTNPDVRGSYILSSGRLRRVPDGMTGLVPSRFGPFLTTPVLSPLAKARVGLEWFIPPKRDGADESIESFVVRRLGREMYDRLVEPLLSGISAGDGARLSIGAMFPQLRDYELKHGGLIRGMMTQRSAPPRSSSAFVSFPGGLEELVRGVVAVVERRARETGRIDIRLSENVRAMTALQNGGGAPRYVLALSNGERLTASAVILATPTFASSAIVRQLDAPLAQALAAIEYTSTATISLAYAASDVPRPLDATGYVVPRRERRPVLACTWTSAKFTGRAPAGHALFRLFLGGVGRVDADSLDDGQLIELARREMQSVVGVTAPPTLVRVNRFESALPQYNVGHAERIAAIKSAAARLPGLELAGAVYRGVGIPDCVQSGIDAAARAVSFVSAASAAQPNGISFASTAL